ncbi:hypothetical protein FIBSPDRAFT_792011 [Athelia psychrophila]|uniref:Berberine/berberine-like domain-containing protein n=1 Tax=Athelia psychrophila TaxID=1759441 RepID=A0A166H102_9AGAM|nr:hypothetical protein FIBSPDRAFT_792011 [Fibularhizoctonia sp. CBS 109695]
MSPDQLMLVGDPLPKSVVDELLAAIRGDVYPQDDSSFVDYSRIFNGSVITCAKAVVCPLDAEDVSRTIIICAKHSLSPSIKSGGFGTAGWAVGGDIIIDMSRIEGIDIEPPLPGGGFTSLRIASTDEEEPAASSSQSGSTPLSTGKTGKRRREDDDNLRSYDNASRTVAGFLRGPELDQLPATTPSEGPSRPIRRRIEVVVPDRQVSVESGTSSATGTGSGSAGGTSSQGQVLSSNTSDADSPSPVPEDEEKRPRLHASTSPDSGFGSGSASSGSGSGLHGSNVNQPPLPTPLPASGGSGRVDPFAYMNLDPHAPSASQPRPRYSAFGLAPGTQPMAANMSMGMSVGMSMNMMASFSGDNSRATPIHTHAYVTFGAGKRQKEIDRYTAAHPLEGTCLSGMRGEVPYHVPFAAHPVGSSVMLLGGFGFQTRLRGFSVDNLVEVEMVLADGRIVIANERENADLWWAVRGAGPAFGVAVRYKALAFPLPVVFAGNLIYRFHRATAPSLIKHFRDCIKGAPRELYANVLLTAGPKGKDSLVVIQLCYLGPKEQGQEYLHAISSWDGERCLLNEVHEKTFLNQQDSVAQVLRGVAGRQWFIRSALVTSLPDDIIHQSVMKFSTGPMGCTWLFELGGGALVDHEDTCIPKSQREASFNIVALHQWEMGNPDLLCRSTAEDWISGTLLPVNSGGPVPAFLARDEPPERVMASYGSNWDRLKDLKKKYDPTGLFRNSFWPLDRDGRVMPASAHEPPEATGVTARPAVTRT